MVQIRGYSEDDVDLLITDFTRVVQGAIDDAVFGVANSLTAAANLTSQDAASITTKWQEQVDGVLTPYIGEVYEGSAAQVAVGLGTAFPDVIQPGVPLVASDFTLTYLKGMSAQLIDVGDELRTDVVNELLNGVEQGYSIPQIAARIKAVSGFEPTRATRIARTAVHSAAEAGSIDQMRMVGYSDDEVEKEWIDTNDARTRPTHVAADKQKVPLNGKFVVGGYLLDHPGDTTAPADEVVNCRCTAVFNVVDPPHIRCGGAAAITAAAHAEGCIVPTPSTNIDQIPANVQQDVYTRFSDAKISPAWGGAKILKVIDDLLADLEQQLPDSAALLDRTKVLSIVDKYYAAKKQTFGEVYHAWSQTPAGKKALGSAPSIPKVEAVKIPITDAGTVPASPPVEVPSVWSPPDGKFKVLDDPGASGDGYAVGGQWGKYGAAGVLVRAKGQDGIYRYLMIQRNGEFDEYEAWKWQLPGGALDELETAYEGAAREVVEELQVPKELVESLKPLGETTYVGPGGWKYTTISADADHMWDVVVDGRELSDAKWFTEAEIKQMLDNGDVVKHLDLQITPQIQTIDMPHIDTPQFTSHFGVGEPWSDIDHVLPEQVTAIANQFAIEHWTAPSGIEIMQSLEKLSKISGVQSAHLSQLQLLRIVDKQFDTKFEAKLLEFFQSTEAKGTIYQKGKIGKSLQVITEKIVKPPVAQAPPPLPPPVVPQPATSLPSVGFGADVSGDISSFDYFFKQDILTDWIQIGGGKKVTPAWGGSKIWKMLEDLKIKLKPQFEAVGLSQPTELQLLRILDDAGGFKGKPKTYESVLTDWLDSPAGKKVVPNPPSSLAKTLIPDVPKVQPIVPIQDVVLDAAGEALQTGQKVPVLELLSTTMKYAEDEIIGYAQTESGVILQLRKAAGDKVAVYFKTPSNQWLKDKTFDLSLGPWDIASEYSWKEEQKFISLVPSKLEVKTATKIPGKMPGDDVSPDEIVQSAMLWKPGDVIAVSKKAIDDFSVGGDDWRLVADGSGGIILQKYDTFLSKWQDSLHFGGNTGNFSLQSVHTINLDWKLTGDSLSGKPVSSKIAGKSAGDAVTSDDIWNAEYSPGETIALAVEDGWEHRWVHNSAGDLVQEMRPVGSKKWSHVFTANTKKEVDDAFANQTLSFKAAKIDGSTPDNVKAQTPTTSTKPTLSPQTSHIPSYPADAPISQSALQDLYAKGQEPFEVLAVGETSLKDWRIYWVDDDVLALESKFKQNGSWEFHQLVKSPSEAPFNIDWKASATKVHPSSDGAKKAKAAAKKASVKNAAATAAKKTNSIPGKTTGDTVNKSEILAAAAAYDDGKVIAYGTSWYPPKKLRIIAVDGHLVRQQQTSAGTWTGSHLVKETWDIQGPDASWKIAAIDDDITAPQLKAAKKFVASKTTTTVTPPKSTPKPKSSTAHTPTPGPAATSTPTAPFQMATVDITPWTQEEQLEMFTYFKTQGVFVTSDPGTIWGAVQSLKSKFQIKYGGKYAQLNEVEVLRMMDAQSAKKFGVADSHPYESKIVQWLKTPAGKAWINKRIDAPIAAVDVPVPMSDFTASTVPADKQTYQIITREEGKTDREKSHAKYGGWTAAQKAAAKKYTGGSYSSWNAAIRRGDISSYHGDIINEQAAMRPSTRSMLVHRGTSFAELNDPSITSYESLLTHVGQTYITRGFTSTSYGGSAAFGGQLLIEIEAPVGTPMAFVADISNYSSEREITLATHLVYKIKSVTKKGGTTVMRVQVIGVAQP